MMNIEKYISVVDKTYNEINFVERFCDFMKVENDFNNRMIKIDKKEILNILTGLGYSFKVFSPGRDFYYEERFNELKLVFSFNCNGGVLVSYIYIYVCDEKLNYQQNLAFVYKHLINDMEALIKVESFLFTNYEEFKKIVTNIIRLYEDFREYFLKNVRDLKS